MRWKNIEIAFTLKDIRAQIKYGAILTQAGVRPF